VWLGMRHGERSARYGFDTEHDGGPSRVQLGGRCRATV